MGRITQKYWKYAMFTVIGAGVGFAYWKFIGCASGTCPMTSNWHTTTLFGGLIGFLAVPVWKDEINKPENENE